MRSPFFVRSLVFATLMVGLVVADAGRSATVKAASVEPPATRTVVLLIDHSRSLKDQDDQRRRLQHLVSLLQPGDRLIVIEITSQFDARLDVPVIVRLPDIIDPSKALTLKAQVAAAAKAREVETRLTAIRKGLANYFARTWTPTRWTDLRGALTYTLRLLKTDDAPVKYVLVFSDLIHDQHGLTTFSPPKVESGVVPGLHAATFFVPWDRTFEQKEAAWRQFWGGLGSTETRMFDSVTSRVAMLIPRAAPSVSR